MVAYYAILVANQFYGEITMPRAVKLSDELVFKASIRAKVLSRSTTGQIEYWANIGQIAEDNPDLSYAFIKDILIASEEAKSNQLEDYQFDEGETA